MKPRIYIFLVKKKKLTQISISIYSIQFYTHQNFKIFTTCRLEDIWKWINLETMKLFIVRNFKTFQHLNIEYEY